MSNIYEKLLKIQTALKAPKGQYNEFGKYNYRNCEDILEAVKPLCKEHGAVVTLTDEVEFIGARFYVKATATLVDVETSETVTVTARAREEESKKGMDGSQITGASSSYARKYALNGLFAIDDTKDNDTTNKGADKSETDKKQNVPFPEVEKKPSKFKIISDLIKGTEIAPEEISKFITNSFGAGLKVNDLNDEQFKKLVASVKKTLGALKDNG